MPQQYTVKSGDTLSKIGQQFGVDYKQITGYSSGNPNLIRPGEVLTIPGGEPAPTPQEQDPSIITPENLQESKPIDLASGGETPLFDVQGLSTTNPATSLTEQETKIRGAQQDIQAKTEELRGMSAYQTEQEAKYGVDQAAQNINDLGARVTQLKNEALAIPIEAQSRSAESTVITGGLQADVNQRLRDNAVAALGASSLLAAAQGQLANAQLLADRAVSQKYDPIIEEINILQSNLQFLINDPLTSLQDKNRAAKQIEIQQERQFQLEEERATKKMVTDLSLTAIQYGADPETARKMQQAESIDDLIAIGGQFLRDPKAQYEVESARLENILRQAQIQQTRAQTAEIGRRARQDEADRAAAEAEAILEKQKSAKSSLAAANDTVSLINSIISSPGKKGSVGAYGIARWTPIRVDASDKRVFAASVDQLISQKTQESLLDLRARGGATGAISDKDIELFKSSATKLANFRKEDEDGNVYFDVSEDAFDREMNILLDITNRGVANATGDILTGDEKASLTEFYSSDPTSFDASNYYSQ